MWLLNINHRNKVIDKTILSETYRTESYSETNISLTAIFNGIFLIIDIIICRQLLFK